MNSVFFPSFSSVKETLLCEASSLSVLRILLLPSCTIPPPPATSPPGTNRCRRRCGGRVKMEHKAMACERAVLVTFLLLTTLVLL